MSSEERWRKVYERLKSFEEFVFDAIPVSYLGVGQGNSSIPCAFKALFRDSSSRYCRGSGDGERMLLSPITKGC